jgi:hypothetical protein
MSYFQELHKELLATKEDFKKGNEFIHSESQLIGNKIFSAETRTQNQEHRCPSSEELEQSIEDLKQSIQVSSQNTQRRIEYAEKLCIEMGIRQKRYQTNSSNQIQALKIIVGMFSAFDIFFYLLKYLL